MPSEPAQPPWFKDGLRFSCQPGCGRCCTGPAANSGVVWLEHGEAARLAGHLAISLADFLRDHTCRLDGRLALVHATLPGDISRIRCVFLNPATAQCRVHAVKPRQCQTFPFWPAILRSQRTWDRAARDCPGMDQGDLITEADLVARLHAGRGLPGATT